MKEEHWICDICGKVIGIGCPRPLREMGIADCKGNDITVDLRRISDSRGLDLCDECKQAITKTIEGRRQDGKYE